MVAAASSGWTRLTKLRPISSGALHPNRCVQAGFTAWIAPSKSATSMTSVDSRHRRLRSWVRSSTRCSSEALACVSASPRARWVSAIDRDKASLSRKRASATLRSWTSSTTPYQRRIVPSAFRRGVGTSPHPAMIACGCDEDAVVNVDWIPGSEAGREHFDRAGDVVGVQRPHPTGAVRLPRRLAGKVQPSLRVGRDVPLRVAGPRHRRVQLDRVTEVVLALPEPRLGRLQRLPGQVLRRAIAKHLDVTAMGAVLAAERHHLAARPEAVAVPAQVPALVGGAALLEAQPHLRP